MRWTEAKKINSDLSQPLNDLIDSKNYGTNFELKTPTCFELTTSADGWTEVINVTGSGVACVGIVKGDASLGNVFAGVRITVDGVVIDTTEDASLGRRHLNGGYVYGLVNQSSVKIDNWGESSFYASNASTNPLAHHPKIGFETSFKYEIRREESTTENVTGTGVVIS